MVTKFKESVKIRNKVIEVELLHSPHTVWEEIKYLLEFFKLTMYIKDVYDLKE